MNDDVERVRARLSIVDVVGRRVALKKSGKAFVGLCPFHDDRKPSMTVNPTLGIYKCFSCGAGGDIFKFVMEMDRLSFPEALKALAEEAGITLSRTTTIDRSERDAQHAIMEASQDFFVKSLAANSAAREYCTKRGLPDEVLKDWGIGFAPSAGEALAIELKKQGFSMAMGQELFVLDQDASGGFYDKFRGRLMFPIRDERGKLVGYGGRALGDIQPKYINSSDTPLFSKRRTLYGMDRAKSKMAETGEAVLVEGYLDVIACHRAGVTSAVASLGTSLSEEQAELIARWAKRAVILYDADAAGQKAAARAEELLSAAGLQVRIALMPDGEDPDTMLQKSGPEAVKLAVTRGLSPIDFRLGQLRKNGVPNQEAFWTDAFQILASAKIELEIERHLGELASLYPGTKDPFEAQQAIRREVQKRRRRIRTGQSAEEPGREVLPKVKLHALEQELFRGLLTPEVSKLALRLLQENPDLITGLGASIRTHLLEHLPNHDLSQPQAWVPRMPDFVRDALVEIEAKSIVKMKPEVLESVVERLKHQLERRAVRVLQTETESTEDGSHDRDKIREITRRLKELKGVKDEPKPESDDLFG